LEVPVQHGSREILIDQSITVLGAGGMLMAVGSRGYRMMSNRAAERLPTLRTGEVFLQLVNLSDLQYESITLSWLNTKIVKLDWKVGKGQESLQ
jgi:hypothetical protein